MICVGKWSDVMYNFQLIDLNMQNSLLNPNFKPIQYIVQFVLVEKVHFCSLYHLSYVSQNAAGPPSYTYIHILYTLASLGSV